MTLLSLSLIPAEMIQDIREPLPNILQAERVLLMLRSQTSDRSDKAHSCENVTDPVTFFQKMSYRGYILFRVHFQSNFF